ncbi:PREDICTED: MAD2L1-binding protein [Dufourea novaeangliae]|uniref:MAD2L1-binding protein n=1 Tax=Dufourea novaeangliae TaxID=178035 RepID=A0A154P2P2_DUFNO|nr:PREDICTED: MAD2L1-binding protein [Dufourea novaeangliae]KZC06209.1 MAD2L1-binding protein [Dufourea novaeangliae]
MDINVTLDEPLTSYACVKLVIELLKYILYQKQQIPFTYDSLTRLQMSVKPTDRNSSSIRRILSSLKSVSEELSSQFHLKNCKVKEIAILIGATIISPKLHVRLQFPSNILSSEEHYECKHTSRKPLLSLMRSMIGCSEFQDAISLPLNPTNTFVLVQKSDRNSVSEFFLPKPQYVPPIRSSNCFVIKFHHNNQVKIDCNCTDIVKVYNEVCESDSNKDGDINVLNNSNEIIKNIPYQWYQSREVIKGFKFIR